MRCPSCGYSAMITKICDEILSYGGKSVILHGMKGNFCPECGDGIWDAESYGRYTKEQAELLNNVGTEIRSIRKRLNMTQVQMAQVVGVGKIAFSRYERGRSRPTPSFLKLLRIMDRHPELIDEIKEPAPIGQSIKRTVCSTRSPVKGKPDLGSNLTFKKE